MPLPDASERCCPWYTVLGRLKPDVTIEQARLELTAIARLVATKHPDGTAAPDVQVVRLRETLVGNQRLALVGLSGAVGCILLIGVANVANLLLARGVSRRREVLTRLAIGATRWRLARHLLTEGVLLGVIGATLGLVVSLWAQDAVRSVMAERVPLIAEIRLDWFVLAFTVGLTLVVSAVCGLVPLVDWRAVEWSARGQTESRTSRRLRHALVVGEVALAVAVVASAGLLVRTVANLRGVTVGIDHVPDAGGRDRPDDVLVAGARKRRAIRAGGHSPHRRAARGERRRRDDRRAARRRACRAGHYTAG